MRLRLFRAATVAEAMRQVRVELGAEALILSTQRVPGGVQVTAGLEPEHEPPPSFAPPSSLPSTLPAIPGSAHQPWQAQDHGSGEEDGRAASLAWHGVPNGLARRLRAGPLAFALSAAVRFAGLPLLPGSRPLLFVGPPGAGKTLTVARLATRLVLAGSAPLVATADGRRAGAAEQLAAFTRVLGLELMAASQPATLARAMGCRKDGAPALIDATGINPFDHSDLAAVRSLADAAGADLVAVLPAGQDPAEAADMAAALAAAGAGLLVATRINLARRLGGVLAAASALTLAEFGIGPGAADGLEPASPGLLARRLAAGCPAVPLVSLPPSSELRS